MTTLAAQQQQLGAHGTFELLQARSAQFNWVFFVVIAAFHLGAVAALFTFHWSSIVVFLVMWFFGQYQLSPPAHAPRLHYGNKYAD